MPKRLHFGCAVAVICSFQAGTAFAADTPVPQQAADEGARDPAVADEQTLGEDILVTARRRDESLQQVPVAVTLLGGEEIAARSVRDLRDVTVSTPNLSINDSGRGATLAFVSLRGLENTNTTIANDPAVGVYIDEVYSARSSGNVMSSLMDVQNVQVLRGVQGTLFGRNNTGGAILITTNKPGLDGVHGNVQFGYGSYDRFDYGAVLDVTLVDGMVGIRGAFQGTRPDPIGFSTTTNVGFANRHRDQGRISARVVPTDGMTLDFSYDKARIDERGPIITSPLQPSTAGFYTTRAGIADPRAYADIEGWSFHGQFDPSDAFGVKMIVSRRSVKTLNNLDLDGTALPSPVFLDARLDSDQKQYTGETQISGRIPVNAGWLSAFNYTAGLFYFWEDGLDSPVVPYTGSLLTAGSISITRGKNESIAGYAQVETNHFDKLFVTLGARYTSDHRKLDVQSLRVGRCALAAFPTTTSPDACHLRGEASYGYWSYAAGVRYQFTSDLSAYVKYDKGQRAGGLDDTPTTIEPFFPEIASGFEAGVKAEVFDRRVRLNLAAFSTRIDGVQRVTVLPGPPPYTSVFNAATARTRGIEAELVVRPVQGLTLQGSLGLLDAHYTRFLDPRPAPNFGVDRSDLEFPDSPKTTYSISGSYEVPLGDVGKLAFRADYSSRSHYYTDVYNAPTTLVDGYGLLNARISLATERNILGGSIEFAVFGKNLTDVEYNGYNSSLFSAQYRSDNPRTFGGEVRYRF